MDKTVIQGIAALLVILQGRRVDWPWWGYVVALIATAVVVHLVYEFVYQRLFGSSRHLGAAGIGKDDPLMLAALEDAKRTWPQFLDLFREHPRDSLVKYRLRTEAGEDEFVWGDLLELDGEKATVYLRTPPVGRVELDGPRMEIPADDIVDWQVMVPDGTLRGGFTQQATFRIVEREQGGLPAKFAKELDRYRPVEEPSP